MAGTHHAVCEGRTEMRLDTTFSGTVLKTTFSSAIVDVFYKHNLDL